METKRPCIRVCACRHVSAPDHLEAGCRLLPLVRGPVTIQVVRDPMRGPGLRGGPDSSGGPEPRLPALECLPLPGEGIGTLSRGGPDPTRVYKHRYIYKVAWSPY